MSENVFEKLIILNVNDKVEKKRTGKTELSYLSWSWAWQEFKKVAPTATYEIKKFENEKGMLVPYISDPALGIMCFTEVTVDGITHEMWLPVMDGANKAMKLEPYTYKTKFGEKSVESATMFDVNKTIMRCLVKNLAMHGLGLYIYAGEDLPDLTEEQKIEQEEKAREAKELAMKKAELRNKKLAIQKAEKLGYPDAEKRLEDKTYKEIVDIMTIWKATEGK
nr:MAG TPA: Protein of unknown function (DUF1071) [Caudoviricetes sp.]